MPKNINVKKKESNQNNCWLCLQLFFAFGLACNYSMTNLQLMDFFILSFG